MSSLAVSGWVLALLIGGVVLALRRRLELTARAEHELRGPLAALALGVEQVRRGRTGAELAGLLEAQLERARAGLADLTAARRGRVAPPRPVSLALDRLVGQTAAGWAPLAVRAGRRLRFDWRAGSAPVTGDRGRLAQALGNLLSNALEHGTGTVVVRGSRVGQGVRIEVANAAPADQPDECAASALRGLGAAGPGLAPRLAERGRGLSIARRAVEEAGGTLELASAEGGTIASMELPVEDH